MKMKMALTGLTIDFVGRHPSLAPYLCRRLFPLYAVNAT